MGSHQDPSLLAPLNVTIYDTYKKVPYLKDPESRAFRGAFGAVYKAICSSGTAEPKVYAIKEIEVKDGKEQTQVERELAMLKRCNHVNILKLEDAYRIRMEPSAVFLVTEPWAQASLRRFFDTLDNQNRSSLCPWYDQSTAVACFGPIFKGFIDGLTYLHEQSIKHKDIKPENLLLHYIGQSQDGLNPAVGRPVIRPIIADLGTSKIQLSCASTNFTHSTYEYLAPEQAAHTESTFKADIFSMGCCFALAVGVVCEGRQGLLSLQNVVMDNSCSFARELRKVVSAMNNLSVTNKSRALRLIAEWMLFSDPAERPDSKSVQQLLATHFAGDLSIPQNSNMTRFVAALLLGISVDLGSNKIALTADQRILYHANALTPQATLIPIGETVEAPFMVFVLCRRQSIRFPAVSSVQVPDYRLSSGLCTFARSLTSHRSTNRSLRM